MLYFSDVPTRNPNYLVQQTPLDLTDWGCSGSVDFTITHQDEQIHQWAHNDAEEWYPSWYQAGWHQARLDFADDPPFQIEQQMSYGEVLPGEAHFDKGCWLQDAMPELHRQDTLWAYCIWGAAWFQRLSHQQVNDPVLIRLLEMGLVNGYAPDNKYNFADHYAAIATSRLLDRLLVLEKQVRR